MFKMMNASKARKLVLLFVACLALGVIAAPIPVAPATHLHAIDPPPPLLGPDGKPVDMSKWPWKRDEDLHQHAKRFYMLPPPIAKLLAVHPATSLPSSGLITREEDVHGHDLRKLNLLGGSSAQKSFSLTSEPEKDKDKTSKSKPAPVLKVHPAALKVQLPSALLPDKQPPIVRPLHNHVVRHRPRSLSWEDEEDIDARDEEDFEERDEDISQERRYYPIGRVLAHDRDIGLIAQRDPSEEDLISERDGDEDDMVFRRFYPLRNVLERDIRLGYFRRTVHPQAVLSARSPDEPVDTNNQENSDAVALGPVTYVPWYEKRALLNTMLDGLERRFWALDKRASQESRRAEDESDLERRWMLLDEWDALERRITDFRALFAKMIAQNGGSGKPDRKSSRPHDANSKTTPGALFNQPGAHSGLPPATTDSSTPVPIERSLSALDDEIDTRGLDMDEHVEELARRLVNYRRVLAGDDKENIAPLPFKHTSHNSFLFNSALRTVIHPHGPNLPNGAAAKSAGQTSFKEQLAAVKLQRGAHAKPPSGAANKANRAKRARERAQKIKAAKAAKADADAAKPLSERTVERDFIDVEDEGIVRRGGWEDEDED